MSYLLPQLALGGLKVASEAGLIHRMRQWITPTVDLPDATVQRGTPYLGPERCCLLKNIGAAAAQIASARGIEAQWTIKVPEGVMIPAKTIWRIDEGCDGGWVETVKVTGDLVKHGRVMRLVAAVDTTLNKS